MRLDDVRMARVVVGVDAVVRDLAGGGAVHADMSDRDRKADARFAEIETWAREIGGLGPDQAVRVTERECSRSGWPPFEVAIAVEVHGVAYERVVHKRIENVTRLDVGGAWRGGDACCGT